MWKEQYDRTHRWFAMFSSTNDGREHDRVSDHYEDERYAFFQNCHHLKDWLKNDPATAALVSDVEDLINGSPNLSLCADIANGSKHLTLKNPRHKPQPKTGRRHFSLNLTVGSEPTISAKYEVVAGQETYDAYTVAKACMAEWEDYLRGKGLLTD